MEAGRRPAGDFQGGWQRVPFLGEPNKELPANSGTEFDSGDKNKRATWQPLAERPLPPGGNRHRGILWPCPFPEFKRAAQRQILLWKASAKQMLVRETRAGDTKPPSDTLQPLTAEEFRSASKRAYQAALRLVAICSNLTEDSLRSCYEAQC